MIRPLMITRMVEEAVQKVVDFSIEEANWYRPAQGDPPPGDKPEHGIMINTYRCVFSVTEMRDQTVWRHLSVSVTGGDPNAYPHPVAFKMIVQLFGFPDLDSSLHTRPQVAADNGCVTVAYPFTTPTDRSLN
jgi:hypothetical protein